MERINAGYRITETISLAGKHYVVGQHTNPNAPSPFVTWETDREMRYFYHGNYFTELQPAQLDMIRRASANLELEERSIGISLLSDEDRNKLYLEFHTDNARQDIVSSITDELEDRGVLYDLDTMLADADFMERAMYIYDNIDHSYENEALKDELANLLDDFPQYTLQFNKQSAQINISPEMAALLKDLLTIPSAQIPDKYGPLGDDMWFDFHLDQELFATCDITPTYDPDSQTLSEEAAHYVNLCLFLPNGKLIASEQLLPEDIMNDNSSGELSMCIKSAGITLVIHEDETLRRVGNSFIFQSSSEADHYAEHNGETCKVVRALTPQECDILCSGLMWEAEFPNGDKLHIFDSELNPVSLEPEQKPSLAQQIQVAQIKTAGYQHAIESSEPER